MQDSKKTWCTRQVIKSLHHIKYCTYADLKDKTSSVRNSLDHIATRDRILQVFITYLWCFLQLLKSWWGLPDMDTSAHAFLMVFLPQRTIAGFGPSRSKKTLPYCFCIWVNARWGLLPSKWRWPIIGSDHFGPKRSIHEKHTQLIRNSNSSFWNILPHKVGMNLPGMVESNFL